MIQKIILLFFGSIFWCNFVTSQGIFDGFAKSKGNLDAAISYTNEMGSGFVANPQKYSFSRTTNSLNFYAVYGINDKLNISTSLPYIKVDNKSSLQDMQIGLRYNICNLEVNTKNRLAFYAAYISSFPVSDYKTQDSKAIGQQAVVHSFKIITQYNFNSKYFIQTQGGYNVAIRPVTNSIPFSVKLGWFKDKWYVDCWFDYKNAIGGSDYPNTSDFRTLGNSTKKLGVTGFYKFAKKFGFGANSSYIIGGRNTFRGLALGATLVFKLEKTDDRKN